MTSKSGVAAAIVELKLTAEVETMWATIVKEFAYQGFDMPACYDKITGVKNWKVHVARVIVWYVLRGANIDASRTTPAGKTKITESKNALDIKKNSKPGRDEITVPRIIAIFAPQVATLIKNRGISARIPVGETGCPDWLAFPQAAAFMYEGCSHYIQWVAWMAIFDNTVNPGKADNAKAIGYAKIAMDNSPFTRAQKEAILQNLDS